MRPQLPIRKAKDHLIFLGVPNWVTFCYFLSDTGMAGRYRKDFVGIWNVGICMRRVDSHHFSIGTRQRSG